MAKPMITFIRAVSRETILISLTTAALNDIEVNSADILNMYFTAPVQENS